MDSNTEVWKLVLSFFLPPLIYTNLISFKSVPQTVFKSVSAKISFLSGTVVKLLIPFDLLGSRRRMKSQRNFIRVKN